MQKYTVGIDTGGTFTDAVLVDNKSGKIVSTTKTPTTHFDLAKGTGEALIELLVQSSVPPEMVESVAVSSTLATNSVVENKGARVAVIVIGYVKHFKLPVKAVVFVKGGHNIKGEEEEALDLEYLVQLVDGLKKEVDAYGVCSAMSIKNPAHELVTEKAISMLDPKPVFCSHRISDLVGMEERAATAGLHAKLMPIMEEFVSGIQGAMAKSHLSSNMVVIGGNGKVLEHQKAVQEAGLTVASGPACSALFGAKAGESDCLVVDVGGTTTDIAMIENGQAVLASEGCRIGRWVTHVEAVDMHTGGIGGDSLVQLSEKGVLTIGPSRATPLATAPDNIALSDWLGCSNLSKLVSLHPNQEDNLPDNDLTRALLKNGSMTPAMIRKETGLGGIPLDNQLDQLSRKHLIFETGFTPTDALHVLNILDFGDNKQARLGAEILGQHLNISAEDFARMVVSQTEEKIENLLLEYVIHRFWGDSLSSFLATRKKHRVLGVDFALKLPIIGIGAAAKHLLPGVAKSLKTQLIIPENGEVGNAIGAAVIAMSQ